jgi:mRNA interferase MazF
MVMGVASPDSENAREKTTISRGDVVEVNLDPSTGREMAKTRPCLVVSNNIANRYSAVINVVPITSREPSKSFPFIVEIPDSANMPKRSWVDAAHIRTVDRSRLTERYYTSLDRATMEKVNDALKEQLSLP